MALDALETCPPLRPGATNGDLIAAYARCRLLNERGIWRVEIWEGWAARETAAHAKLRAEQ